MLARSLVESVGMIMLAVWRFGTSCRRWRGNVVFGADRPAAATSPILPPLKGAARGGAAELQLGKCLGLYYLVGVVFMFQSK